MRLTAEQITIIKDAAVNNFGGSSKVYLFGSRVDDAKKGGDIDLFVKADFPPEDLFIRKIKMLTVLQFKLGDRKIDIVTYNSSSGVIPSPVVRGAISCGIEL